MRTGTKLTIDSPNIIDIQKQTFFEHELDASMSCGRSEAYIEKCPSSYQTGPLDCNNG